MFTTQRLSLLRFPASSVSRRRVQKPETWHVAFPDSWNVANQIDPTNILKFFIAGVPTKINVTLFGAAKKAQSHLVGTYILQPGIVNCKEHWLQQGGSNHKEKSRVEDRSPVERADRPSRYERRKLRHNHATM